MKFFSIRPSAILSTLLLVTCFVKGYSQSVSGPSSAGLNMTTTYMYSEGSMLPGASWTISKGTIVTSWTASSVVYYVTVKWTTLGAGSVTFSGSSHNPAPLSVTVINCPAIGTPTVTNGSVCGSGYVNLSATPGSGATSVNWYANGGTTVLGVNNTYSPSVSTTTNFQVLSLATTGCQSAKVTAVATVKTVPTVSFSTVFMCNGTTFSAPMTNNIASTTNTWTVTSTGVNGATAGSGVSGSTSPYTYTLGQPLTLVSNDASATYRATYTVTPSANGCTGSPSALNVYVNPTPVIGASSQSVFNGQSTSIGLSNVNSVISPQYTWTATQTNVTGAANGSGSAGTSISQLLNTTTSGAGTVTYSIIATSQSCQSAPLPVVATVFPSPVISAPQSYVARDNKVTLDAGAGYASYSWKGVTTGSTVLATTQTYATNIPDTYTVTVSQPGGATTSVSYVLGSQLSGINMNAIIMSTIMSDSITDPATVDFQSVKKVNQNITYFDGLGRPIQNVETQGSPLKKDIIVPIVYDNLGREYRSYLPVTAETNGRFKNGILDVSGNYAGAALNYYNNGTSDKIIDDGRPFTETTFEASPLHRPITDIGPGQNWKTANKSITHGYLLNQHGTTTGKERIIYWRVDNTTNMPVHEIASNVGVSGGYYTTGQLIVKSTKDEQGHEIREYTDKMGHMILKKVQAVESPILKDSTHWTQTYYIYDDLGMLRYVLQPELTKYITLQNGGTYNPNAADLSGQSFQYKYDNRHRLVTKVLPGTDSVFMIYDNRDRLVMTQDGVQRPKMQWLVTKYDSLNRPVLTALYTHTSVIGRAAMKALISTTKFCEYYAGASQQSNHGYSLNVWPKTNLTILTVYYYDNYNFITNLTEFATGYGFVTNDLSGQQTTDNIKVIGAPTGIKVNVLGTTTYLKTVGYLDAKYRFIQIIMDNSKGGYDRTTNIVDFAGRVQKTIKTHHTSTHTDQTITRRFVYDHKSRIKQVFHTLNSQTEKLLYQTAYNELGQLVDKGLYSTDGGATVSQSVDYRYNIRGWLTSINNSTLTADATNDETTDLFGMTLAYEQADATLANTALYNGNISGAKWSVGLGKASVSERGYNFSYDAMNRLTAANSRMNKTTWQAGYYDETISQFDLNGNIKNLQRKGDKGVVIDNLTYYYGTGATATNKLLYVQDNATDVKLKWKGFYDGNSGTATDYSYDTNGSLTRDLNKGIGTSITDPTNLITYNHLNLPETVTKAGNTVKYTYDATGRKISQVVTYANTQKQTEYDGEFVYENDALQFINHDEGRIMMSGTKVIYTNSFNNVGTDLTAVNTVLDTISNNGEKYVRVKSSNTTAGNGVFPIGGTYTVQPGDRYRIRLKGYRTTNAVYLQVKAGTTILSSSGTALSNSVTTESWIEQIVTIPASTNSMQVGVVWGSIVTTNEIFYLNEIEIDQLTTSATPEYQYELKDNLGNIRVTFTTQNTTQTYTAGFETTNQSTEAGNFKNYPSGAYVNTAAINAHTGSNSEYMSGGLNGQVGIAKSFPVIPGDQLQIQAYAKFSTPSGTAGNLTGFASALLGAFNLSAPAAGEANTASSAINAWGGQEAGGYADGSNASIKVFVNIILFDKNYNFLDVSYQAVTSSGALMSASYTVKEPGYAFMYISNEHPTLIDVYFDDITMSVIQSPIVSSNDYYPFGLTYNSYTRENTVPDQYKYNGKEEQDELNLNWLDYGARMYMNDIGRWGVIDPLTEKSRRWSPYTYALDNPVRFIDPDGMEAQESDDDRRKRENAEWEAIDAGASPSDVWGAGKAMRGSTSTQSTSVTVAATSSPSASTQQSYNRRTRERRAAMEKNKTQQAGLGEQLLQFIAYFFRKELNQVKLPIDIKIDPNLSKDVGGETGRTIDNRIEMHIAKSALSDAKRLFVILGHELIHARDFNPGGYYDYFANKVKKDRDAVDELEAIMEYHAYQWDAPAEEQLGISPRYGADNLESYTISLEFYSLINLVNEYLNQMKK